MWKKFVAYLRVFDSVLQKRVLWILCWTTVYKRSGRWYNRIEVIYVKKNERECEEEVKRKYYDNGKIYEERYYKGSLLHRDEGPAFVNYYIEGNVSVEGYYKDSRLHRLDGPAIKLYNGDNSIKEEHYYIDGKEYKDIFQYLVVVASLKGRE